MKASRLLVGLVTPDVLDNAEMQNNLVNADLQRCDVLEIRYDLFANTDCWPLIAARVALTHPSAQRMATIRLKRDGGQWPDSKSEQRFELWQGIMQAPVSVHILDIEMECTALAARLKPEIQAIEAQVIFSRHYFDRIPAISELNDALSMCHHAKVAGFKVACMSTTLGDTAPLYDFIRAHAAEFSYFALFAMGPTGQSSRLYSLACGANLTYGAIGTVQAPGQIQVSDIYKLLSKMNTWNSELETTQALEALT